MMKRIQHILENLEINKSVLISPFSILIVTLPLLLIFSTTMSHAQIDIQGHRGCRGMLPENSIAGFLKAVELGVTTLEMDVVITGDGKVLVSHEPWMSHEICLDRNGNKISRAGEKQHNIYNMNYSEVIQYDCGSLVHPRFSQQKPVAGNKPLLIDVFSAVEAYVDSLKRNKVFYNIEIKSVKGEENLFQPSHQKFCELVVQIFKKSSIENRFNLQSFDVRVLQYLKENYPTIKLALLVSENENAEDKVAQCGFVPEICSPYFKLINANLKTFCVKQKMKLIPWTVNDETDMQAMIKMQVDGIITDYPGRLINLLKAK